MARTRFGAWPRSRFGAWPPAAAVIVGGSSGIGLALAGRLAAAGTRVALVARDRVRLEAAAAGIGALALAADAREAGAVAAALAAAEAAQGPAELLVAAQGAVRAARFEALSEADHLALTETNLHSVRRTLAAALPGMRARGRGRALILGSAAAHLALPGYGAYGPTKYALRGLAEALRAECRPDGVLVAIAHPPDTETPQLAAERAERPPETAALAAAAGAWPAEAVAVAILRGLARDRAEIEVGLAAAALARLGPLARPLLRAWVDRAVARARRDEGG